MGALFIFLMGFGFAVSGGVTMIAYLNFLPAGFEWIDYLFFIRDRPECYLFPVGVVMISIAILLFPNESC